MSEITMSSKTKQVLGKKGTKMKVEFKTQYGEHLSPGIDCAGDPGMTNQADAADCDIHNIMKKFQATGVLPGADKKALYGDFSDPLEFQEAMNVVARAEEQFANLTSRVRERFGNDPQKFLEFVSNPENAKEMVKLGLAEERRPEAPPEPQKVIVVDDPKRKPASKAGASDQTAT
ncbi:scaffold protein [Microviridae sp.]|nr:scaffold protein [Microviridae sp.]